MRTPLASSVALSLTALLTLGTLASTAHAENAAAPADCPPGSVGKASGAFAWCEPTVCVIDTDCGAGMLCRPIPLCMNAGTVGGAQKDAATRLSVTNVCGPNKSCPTDTVCSELPRCVDPAVAKRMNLTPAGSASAAPAASAEPAPAKKSSCGCTVVGAGGDAFAAIGGALVVVAIAARRRRASRS